MSLLFRTFMASQFTNHLLFIVFALAICSGCGSGWSDTIARQNHEPGSIAEIDSIAEKFMKKYDMPGLSLAIAKNDSLLYVKGYFCSKRSYGFHPVSNRLFVAAYNSNGYLEIGGGERNFLE